MQRPGAAPHSYGLQAATCGENHYAYVCNLLNISLVVKAADVQRYRRAF